MPFKSFLIVSLFLLILSGCGNDSSSTGSDYDYNASSTFKFTFPVTDQVMLALINISGSVEVTGVQNLDTIYVVGTRHVSSSVSQADAEDNLSEIQIITKNETTHYTVESDQPQSGSQREYSVDYVIRMPADMLLDLAQTTGTVNIESMHATLDIANVTGYVNIADHYGSLHVAVVQGDLTVECDLPTGGSVQLNDVNGSIDLLIPTTTSAMFSANALNGTINLYDLTLDDADVSEHAVSGRFGGGQGSINLSSSNGNISVTGT
ncbi:MAG TPA: DUF4097 family beta strand repeat-containing protein [candidate division Zixibacteria bacterium]|nr:DUF4097 family beta strand repeat-containing protein [candidate division Zixibacteria bacterium]